LPEAIEQQWRHGTAKLAAEQLFGLFGNGARCIVVYTLFFKFHFNGNITNSATAVLLAPIAISTADTLGLMQTVFIRHGSLFKFSDSGRISNER
jgi:di/tricarboxylate transporter